MEQQKTTVMKPSYQAPSDLHKSNEANLFWQV